MYKGEALMFSEEDVDNAGDMLKATIIRICIDKQITYEDFTERHRKYMLSQGCQINKIVSNRNNLLKVLINKDTMTYRMFETVIRNILGLNMIGLSMTFKDSNNRVYSVSNDRITF